MVEVSDYKKSKIKIDIADVILVLSWMLEINEVEDSTCIEWGDPYRFFGGIGLFKADKTKN
jgi:hypothetical protein